MGNIALKIKIFSPAASCMSSFINNCHCSLFLIEPLCKDWPDLLQVTFACSIAVNFEGRGSYSVLSFKDKSCSPVHSFITSFTKNNMPYPSISSRFTFKAISPGIWKFGRQIWGGLAFPSWLKTEDPPPPRRSFSFWVRPFQSGSAPPMLICQLPPWLAAFHFVLGAKMPCFIYLSLFMILSW